MCDSHRVHGGLGKSLDWERSESRNFFLAKLVKRLSHYTGYMLRYSHSRCSRYCRSQNVPSSCLIEQSAVFSSPNFIRQRPTSLTVLVDYESRTYSPIGGPRPLEALKLERDKSGCDNIPTLQVTSRYSQSLRHVRPMRILPLCAVLAIPTSSVTLPPTSTLPTSAFHVPYTSVCHSHRPSNQNHYCGMLPRRRPVCQADKILCPPDLEPASAYHPCVKRFPKIQRRWWEP